MSQARAAVKGAPEIVKLELKAPGIRLARRKGSV
jgi:hypothetical protein